MDLGSVHKLAGDETSGADPWFQMVRVTRNNILFRCIKGILRPGISRVECPSCNSDIVRTRILELTECAWAGPGPTLEGSGKSLAGFYWLRHHRQRALVLNN